MSKRRILKNIEGIPPDPIRYGLESVLKITYPPVCEGCGEAYFEGELPGVCGPCHDSLLHPVQQPCCAVCGQMYHGKMPAGMRCGNCGNRQLSFDFAIAAYQAEEPLLDWVHRFKYQRKIQFARTFGSLLNRVWEDNRLTSEKDWVVVPVPLHRRRFRERGFNQSTEIAREWMRNAPPGQNLRLVNALKRDQHTRRQASLNRIQRLTNLKDAFSLANIAQKKCSPTDNFLLLDDVLTTGTTASECASILKKSYPSAKIAVITVLRG